LYAAKTLLCDLPNFHIQLQYGQELSSNCFYQTTVASIDTQEKYDGNWKCVWQLLAQTVDKYTLHRDAPSFSD